MAASTFKRRNDAYAARDAATPTAWHDAHTYTATCSRAWTTPATNSRHITTRCGRRATTTCHSLGVARTPLHHLYLSARSNYLLTARAHCLPPPLFPLTVSPTHTRYGCRISSWHRKLSSTSCLHTSGREHLTCLSITQLPVGSLTQKPMLRKQA